MELPIRWLKENPVVTILIRSKDNPVKNILYSFLLMEKHITATSTMPKPVPLDSLTFVLGRSNKSILLQIFRILQENIIIISLLNLWTAKNSTTEEAIRCLMTVCLMAGISQELYTMTALT